jgi:broad specificity phosphatase PhoE
MATTKIMVIRHAEKPNGEAGLMPDGRENPEALTPTGWRRAEAIIGLFDPPDGHFVDPRLARPESIFASGNRSLRPQQTVMPLARKLGLLANTSFMKGNEFELVQTATTIDAIVLISWQHEAIPAIAALILGGEDGVPPKWPARRFDLIWVFDRPNGISTWTFAQVPQMLLASDSSEPISLNEPGP